ncbi:hypothetical protein MMC24_001591 [Lignoscripta atroalba]|nr:hypothetical protein [Lignoscripta atroalba]
MPPFIPRKRRRTTPPAETPTPKSAKKPTLFDTLDKPKASGSVHDNQNFLDALGGSDSDTSLSDVNSSEFEEALPQRAPKRHKPVHHDEDEDEIDWEDAIHPGMSAPIAAAGPSGDLELTLDKGARIGSLTNPHDKKKGPSKIERRIRVVTHCLHVQFLLFHNLMRNAWVCDKEVQKILVQKLPAQIKERVRTWKRHSGMIDKEEIEKPRQLQRGTKGRKRGGRAADNPRSQRDWGRPAEKQERGAPNMSRGDPIIRLMEHLSSYWKKSFRITSPGLRKQGYKSLASLEVEIASFQNDIHDPEEHGERIAGLVEFRECAKQCEGSRDVGAQLFVALVRGLGIEARMVASLQPVGFGWSKNEEASTKKKRSKKASTLSNNTIVDGNDDSDSESDEESAVEVMQPKLTPDAKGLAGHSAKGTKTKKRTNGANGGKDAPIDILTDSALDSAPGVIESDDSDNSVVNVTPSTFRRKPNMNYDKDMPFPTYWAEVVSPITNEIYPVDPLILKPPVASGADQLAGFEPRGARADKAKLVLAYIIAYSPDGTAKDVTTRYLKRHMWPGKTKGVRMPVEKVPVLNKRGKVKHYEEYDWFKTMMSGYARTDEMRTAVDDLEEVKDLKALKTEKKDTQEGGETLQGYKNSAEFVLERHLRREEAILPSAKPVKVFLAGKGDKAKEEPVFRRKDVMICRTGESWHKEGRQIKAREFPMKMVPVRAVTLTRKREVEEAERDGGEKLKQGLYAWDQTEWIIPPRIENGVIPKNAFGNIDCYVPTMVPKGAVHIPLKSTMRICKRLGIDYAEAVTGFEFGKQRAVPVITGVVVATENEDLVIDEWEKDEEERRIKEEGKREKMALSMWRKFIMGLRIMERVREEYGDDANDHMKEEMNPFTNNKKKRRPSKMDEELTPNQLTNAGALQEYHDEDRGGGFLPDDNGDEAGGGFFPPGHEEESEQHSGGGFVIEEELLPNRVSPANLVNDTKSNSATFQFRGLSDDDEDDELESQVEAKHPKSPPSVPNSLNSYSSKSKPTSLNGTKTNKSQRRSHIATKTGKPPSTTTKHRTCTSVTSTELSDPGPSSSSSSPPPQPPSSNPLGSIAKSTKNNKPSRTAPKRKAAARKSSTAVKSHYFTHDTEDEDEDEDNDLGESSSTRTPAEEEDEAGYKPPVPRKGKNKAKSSGVATTTTTTTTTTTKRTVAPRRRKPTLL